MTTYGLVETGFLPKSLTVIREELNASLREAFGSSIDLGDRAIFGQIVGILSEVYALLWELSEAVNNSQDPDAATGAALDALSALTGTFRPNATHSSVILTLVGTPATVVAEASTATTASTALSFETSASATITLLDEWLTGSTYAVGDRVFNDTSAYECIDAGTTTDPGPVGTDSVYDDGGVSWTYLGEGTGAIDVAATSVDTGPITGTARDITVIGTAIDGWVSVINLSNATPGRALATDAELRSLRQLELASAGRSTADSIVAALYGLSDTISATLFVNNEDTTDSNGLPPHSVEALVRGILSGADEDQEVLDTLFANVAAGILTYGTTSGVATDSQGIEHEISFSRPDPIPIYVRVDIIKDDELYPSDGDDQVKEAIVAWGDQQSTGKNAVSSGIAAQAFLIPGVLDVTLCYIDVAPTPTVSTTIAIELRELATYDVDDIEVNSTSGTP